MAMTDAGQEIGRDVNALTAAFFSGPMVDAVVRTTESYGKACLALHEEILRFAAARLQRDTELGQALASTRNWADAAKLQQEWAASAIRDYTNETTRLFEIATDAGSKITETSVPPVAAMSRMASETARETARAAGESMRSAAEATTAAAEEARAETPRPEIARAEIRSAEPSRPRARRASSTE